MKIASLSLMYVCACALFASSAFADSLPTADSDSGIFGPKYQEILSKMETWKADYSDITTIIDYGQSIEKRPLRLVLVMKPGKWKTRPTFLMSGSTHGNEYLNIEDRLPEELLKKSGGNNAVGDFLDKGGAFVFVPILNPDGYDRRMRHNLNNVDLNRDWDVPPANFKGFKEIETRSLRDVLAELAQTHGLQYKVTVDYHCCIGALLYPWSYTQKPLGAEPLLQHKNIGKVVKDVLNVESGTTHSVLGYYALGTTKDYYYDAYGALAFTYEGAYAKEKNYLPQHVAWWESMVAGFSTGFRDLPMPWRDEVFLSLKPKTDVKSRALALD